MIPRISEVKRVVSSYYGLTIEDMDGACRAREKAHPRQVAMFLAHTLTNQSMSEIARRFGRRDHTTVIHAIKQVEARARDERYEGLYDELVLLTSEAARAAASRDYRMAR